MYYTVDLKRSFCFQFSEFMEVTLHHLNSLYSIFLLLNYNLSSLVSAAVLVCEIIIIIIIIIRTPRKVLGNYTHLLSRFGNAVLICACALHICCQRFGNVILICACGLQECS